MSTTQNNKVYHLLLEKWCSSTTIEDVAILVMYCKILGCHLEETKHKNDNILPFELVQRLFLIKALGKHNRVLSNLQSYTQTGWFYIGIIPPSEATTTGKTSTSTHYSLALEEFSRIVKLFPYSKQCMLWLPRVKPQQQVIFGNILTSESLGDLGVRFMAHQVRLVFCNICSSWVLDVVNYAQNQEDSFSTVTLCQSCISSVEMK